MTTIWILENECLNEQGEESISKHTKLISLQNLSCEIDLHPTEEMPMTIHQKERIRKVLRHQGTSSETEGNKLYLRALEISLAETFGQESTMTHRIQWR